MWLVIVNSNIDIVPIFPRFRDTGIGITTVLQLLYDEIGRLIAISTEIK